MPSTQAALKAVLLDCVLTETATLYLRYGKKLSQKDFKGISRGVSV